MKIGQFNQNAQRLVRHVRHEQQQQDAGNSAGITNGIGNANAGKARTRERV